MFFTYVFIFLFIIAICSIFTKYPIFLGIFLTIGAYVWVTWSQNNKKEKETIEKSVIRIRKELEDLSFNVSKEICLSRNKVVSEFASSELIIDNESKRIAVCFFYKDELTIIAFNELINCEISEDNEIIQSYRRSLKSNSSLVIGMAAKPIKSSIKTLSIKIETSNSNNPMIIIPLITVVTDKKDYKYFSAKNTADDVYSNITKIIRQYRGTQLIN